jgi:hypothetical protein
MRCRSSQQRYRESERAQVLVRGPCLAKVCLDQTLSVTPFRLYLACRSTSKPRDAAGQGSVERARAL